MIDQRGAPRFPIILIAEVRQLPSETTLNGRTSDVSRTGCYVDSLHPFPGGTVIRVKLMRGNEIFESTGTVVYVTPGLGMGIVFDNPVPRIQLGILDRWIVEAARKTS